MAKNDPTNDPVDKADPEDVFEFLAPINEGTY